jgi:PAS domain S-box-containing protein
MSFRRKIIVICLSLLLTALAISAGAFYVFKGMGEQMEMLQVSIGSGIKHIELQKQTELLRISIDAWNSTGDINYKNAAIDSIDIILSHINELSHDYPDTKDMLEIKPEIIILKDALISTSDYPGSLEFAFVADNVNSMLDLLSVQLDSIHLSIVVDNIDSINASKRYRAGITTLLIGLFIISALIVGILTFMVVKLMDEPYSRLLEATKHISSGNLFYKLKETMSDAEFDLIAKRFNEMVDNLRNSDERLHSRISQTELLLEAARISERLENLPESLKALCVSAREMLAYDNVMIVSRVNSGTTFKVLSTSSDESVEDKNVTLPEDLIRTIEKIPSPRRVPAGNLSGIEIGDILNVLIVPMYAEQGILSGFMALSGASEIKDDEYIDFFMLLSKILEASLKEAEFHGKTQSSLKQLTLINDLSHYITSVFDPKELIDTLAPKIANLTSSKLCIIRILRGNTLDVVSSYGPLDEKSSQEKLPIGVGFAGRVARDGKPWLLKNTENLPDELNSSPLSSKTAIAVPLEKEGRIVGVLGMYDKLDENGNDVFFTDEDMLTAQGLASIIAIALERASLQKEHEIAVHAKELSEKRLALLFESVQGGIVTLDRNYNIKLANNYIERWCDKPVSSIIGKSALDVFHEKEGICPHCAATGTFKEGGLNTITQSFGLNYAELSSYPAYDDNGAVTEAVVFIQDITDRVLYQEEIMGLYREVVRNKEYIESLINNSADAIITTDLEGEVISWNPAAESIYGFSSDAVIGNKIPNIPERLEILEFEHFKTIQSGDVINTETFRKKDNGSEIEISLTMSPIKDASGEIIAVSNISRDISERKRVEKELIRRNQELSRLFLISSAARGTLDLDVLIRMILSTVTIGDGLGFNRSILFLSEKEENKLTSYLGVGPTTYEEASRIWDDLSTKKVTLQETLNAIESGKGWDESFLDRIGGSVEISLDEDTVMSRVAKERKPYIIDTNSSDLPVDKILVERLGTQAYAAVPLISRDKVIGVIWVDNKFTMKPITFEDVKFLTGFADQVSSAIENARLFQKVSLAEAELENIFSSISDMIFLTEKDYTIKNVNQAVINKIGLPREQIVGEKCYRIFHGTEEPLHSCPHHTTVEELIPLIKEVEDEHLKGTFITSTAPLFSREGTFAGTVHVMRDITEMSELKSRLQASEKMAALGEVAAKVAHEIRNPLVSVGGFAKRLELELEEPQKEFANIISGEVRRLEKILKEILGFAKEVRQHKRLVNLNDIINDVVHLMRPEFDARGNVVETEFEEGGFIINLDPDRFREVIFNILSNANIACSGGTIHVRSYKDENSCVFEVEDSGTGIAEGEIRKIFDPFFTTKTTGTGLGLAVTKRIVEENQGKISVMNKPTGDGAIFRVYLPLQEELDENSRS